MVWAFFIIPIYNELVVMIDLTVKIFITIFCDLYSAVVYAKLHVSCGGGTAASGQYENMEDAMIDRLGSAL